MEAALPPERAALLLARIHDAASELLGLSAEDPTLKRLRVPLAQIRGAAMRAAGKLDDGPLRSAGEAEAVAHPQQLWRT